ncbi:MAG: hypothetical protein GY770_22495 [Aestuariibacter sp.]|nr:hypothetical protein [Aestuariibacter sp.]
MSVVVDCDLPENWAKSKIGDFAHTTSGGTPKRSMKEYYGGNIPWVKSGDLNDGALFSVDEYITELGLTKSSAKLFKPGTLLIALYGATIGRLALLQFEASTNQAVCGITLPEEVYNKYLFYYLLSVREKLIEQGKGGAQPNISQGVVKDIEVPLAPPEQQKRIVAKIEELFSHIDAGIEALKKAKQLLKQYRQSVLKAAVTGELTKEWREARIKDEAHGSANVAGGRTPGATKLEPASQLLERILQERRQKWEEQQLEQFKAKGKMPKNDRWKEKYKEPEGYELDYQYPGWLKCRLDLLSVALGGYAFKSKNFSESGHQIVKMANIKMEVLDLDNRPSFMEALSEDLVAKYKILNNDILITLTGTREKRDYGYVVHIVNNKQSLLLNQRIARLRTYLPETAKFLSILLQSEPFRNVFFSYETGNVGQGNVGMRAVTEVNICLPSLEEQSEIVAQYEEKIQAANRLDEELECQLLKAEKNKQSILASAFSGKLM